MRFDISKMKPASSRERLDKGFAVLSGVSEDDKVQDAKVDEAVNYADGFELQARDNTLSDIGAKLHNQSTMQDAPLDLRKTWLDHDREQRDKEFEEFAKSERSAKRQKPVADFDSRDVGANLYYDALRRESDVADNEYAQKKLDGTLTDEDIRNRFDEVQTAKQFIANADFDAIESIARELKAKGQEIATSKTIARDNEDASRQRYIAMQGGNTLGDYIASRTIGDRYYTSNLQDKIESVTNDIIKLAKFGKKQKAGKDGFINSFAQGAVDAVKTLRTWDMGIADLIESTAYKKLIERASSGEKLTEQENAALDSLQLLETLSKQINPNLSYKAAQTSISSLPFMGEMILNPMSGVGRAVGKKILQQGTKAGIKSIAKAGSSRVARGVGEAVLGATISAPLMTITSGLPSLLADANNEIANGEDKSKAYSKALLRGWIERGSEFAGSAIDVAIPAGFFKNIFGNISSKLPSNQITRQLGVAMSRLGNSSAINSIRKGAQVQGWFSETGEELLGGVANALLVGDEKLSDYKKLETYVETAIMLLPTQVVFGLGNVASYNKALYDSAGALKRARAGLEKLGMQADEIAKLDNHVTGASQEEVSALAKAWSHKMYTAGARQDKKGVEEAQAVLSYILSANESAVVRGAGERFDEERAKRFTTEKDKARRIVSSEIGAENAYENQLKPVIVNTTGEVVYIVDGRGEIVEDEFGKKSLEFSDGRVDDNDLVYVRNSEGKVMPMQARMLDYSDEMPWIDNVDEHVNDVSDVIATEAMQAFDAENDAETARQISEVEAGKAEIAPEFNAEQANQTEQEEVSSGNSAVVDNSQGGQVQIFNGDDVGIQQADGTIIIASVLDVGDSAGQVTVMLETGQVKVVSREQILPMPNEQADTTSTTATDAITTDETATSTTATDETSKTSEIEFDEDDLSVALSERNDLDAKLKRSEKRLAGLIDGKGFKSKTKEERKAEIKQAREDVNAIKSEIEAVQKEIDVYNSLKQAEDAPLFREEYGVIDISTDSNEKARERGHTFINGEQLNRQEPISKVEGAETSIRFSDKEVEQGNYVLVEADELIASHENGQANPMHFFLGDAQPKNRKDDVSQLKAHEIASKINPQEITEGVTAYSGAPVINERGETIQGNNRSASLRLMYNEHEESAKAYKQYLIDNAERFGLDASAIEQMKNPVLARMVKSDDNRSVALGQMTQSDVESGSAARIDGVRIFRKTSEKQKRTIMRILFETPSTEDMGLNDYIRRNAERVLQYMHSQGLITDNQLSSAFDGDGKLGVGAIEDLRQLAIGDLFSNSPVHNIEDFFERLSKPVQSAILSTTWQDSTISEDKRIKLNVQMAIVLASDTKRVARDWGKSSADERIDALFVHVLSYDLFSGVENEKLYTALDFELAALFCVDERAGGLAKRLNAYYREALGDVGLFEDTTRMSREELIERNFSDILKADPDMKMGEVSKEIARRKKENNEQSKTGEDGNTEERGEYSANDGRGNEESDGISEQDGENRADENAGDSEQSEGVIQEEAGIDEEVARQEQQEEARQVDTPIEVESKEQQEEAPQEDAPKEDETMGEFAERKKKSKEKQERSAILDNESKADKKAVESEPKKEKNHERKKRGSEEADGQMGSGEQSKNRDSVGTRVDKSDVGDISDTREGSSGTIGEAAIGSTSEARSVKRNLNNYRHDGTEAPNTPKARFRANVEAIKLVKQLQAEERKATPEEQKVLAQYTGWGGLGTFFNNNNDENQLLRSLLTKEELRSIESSLNSAYFTPKEIIDSLWVISEKLGFKGGKILEGSAGVGSMLANMPQSVSEASAIEAVEKDAITGAILGYLYPDAQTHVAGFEDVQVAPNSVDLAITNVPFVTNANVYDARNKDLSKRFRDVHNFCIAKNIRALREGGIGIFISSSGTLDGNSGLTKWISEEGGADVIGAFRLNNETFGGTNATSDIIIIRKRVGGVKSAGAIDVSKVVSERSVEWESNEREWNSKTWKHEPVVKKIDIAYNGYFVEHPENMAGEMRLGFEEGDQTYRPESLGLYPKGKSQSEMIGKWVEGFSEQEHASVGVTEVVHEESGAKEGELFANSDGDLCLSINGEAVSLGINKNKVKGKYEKTEVLSDYNDIKSAISELLDYQENNSDDKKLSEHLERLNKVYDAFVEKYGYLSNNMAISFLRNDAEFPLISSIEILKDSVSKDGSYSREVSKGDVFGGRVINNKKTEAPKTLLDAYVMSIRNSGVVNTAEIASSLGVDEDVVREQLLDSRMAFLNPLTGSIEPKHVYLSGNIREKLDAAEEMNDDGSMNVNVEALKSVLPPYIPPHLIDISIGSTWLPVRLFDEYAKLRFGVENLNLVAIDGVWKSDKSPTISSYELSRSSGVTTKAGYRYGYELFMLAMNNKTDRITYSIGYGESRRTEFDREGTEASNVRIGEIKDDFKAWIQERMRTDEALGRQISDEYNRRFNCMAHTEIDADLLPDRFENASNKITLHTHQKRAVMRSLTSPLMLAHEVGAGKTFVLISSAMEMKRTGMAQKPVVVVQNSTLGQFVSEAKALYPNAKILTLDSRDNNPRGRQAFFSRMRHSDFDIAIIPQSTFNAIPDNPEREEAFIRRRIEEKEAMLTRLSNGSNNIAVSDLKRELKSLSGELKKCTNRRDAKREGKALDNVAAKSKHVIDRRTDETYDFDELGIDAIFIDEAHAYKRLGFSTAIGNNVKGIDTNTSKAAASLYMKVRAIMERNNGRNVVFATGTPISNTAAELWTFMRYLLSDEMLKNFDIEYFDDFVRNFGSIEQSLEFGTNGKFKEYTRFGSYRNVQELIRMWSIVSDTVLTKDIDYINDKIPEIKGGVAEDIFVPQSKSLVTVMKAIRQTLEEYEKMDGKGKKANSHIPIVMFGLAQRAAIDARLVYNKAADEPNSKLNKAVDEVYKELESMKDYKGTIAVFCDNYQRKDSDGTIGFNVYKDMQDKLIERGIPENEIFIMKAGMSTSQKEKVFDAVNSGRIRVIFGSTATLGTGVNIQERLGMVIHLDAPNRPMDYTQRNGRILRQGNLHKVWGKPVRVVRFGVEDSLDVTAYQRLKIKSSFIDSIMDGKRLLSDSISNRSLDDTTEEGVFDNPIAILSGSEYAQLKNQAERELRKLELKKKQYEQDQLYVSRELPNKREDLESINAVIYKYKEVRDNIKREFPEGKAESIDILGREIKDQKGLDAVSTELINKRLDKISKEIEGDYFKKDANYTFDISVDGVPFKISVDFVKRRQTKGSSVVDIISRKISYSSSKLGIDSYSFNSRYPKAVIEHIRDNVIDGSFIDGALESATSSAKKIEDDIKRLESRVGKTFDMDAEIESMQKKVDELTQKMKTEMEAKEAKYSSMSESEDMSISDFNIDEPDDLDTPVVFRLDESAELSKEERSGSVGSILEARDERLQRQAEVREHADSIAKGLNTPVEYVYRKDLDGKKKKAKGWYDVKTGKVFVVVDNAESTADVEKTILHEIVGHKGLRDMLGEEKHGELMDAVFDGLDPDLQELLKVQYDGNTRVAAEEYVAELAEEMPDISLFEKVASIVRNIFRKLGIDIKMDDGDIMYLLYLSKNRLKSGDSVTTEVTKRKNLEKVQKSLDEYSEVMYRMSNEEVEDEYSNVVRKDIAMELDKKLNSRKMRMREAYQDAMISWREFQDAIGEPIADGENVYLFENQSDSVAAEEVRQFEKGILKGLEDNIRAANKLINIKDKPKTKDKISDLDLYFFAKHAPERHEEMARKETAKVVSELVRLKKLSKTSKRAKNQLIALSNYYLSYDAEAFANDEIDVEELTERVYELINDTGDFAAVKAINKRLNEYGFESMEAYVSFVEKQLGEELTENLWKSVRAVTGFSIDKWYNSGMMSRKAYDKIKGKYKYYVPMRGYAEEVAHDVYDYYKANIDPRFSDPLISAEGRGSLPDAPLSFMRQIAHSAIIGGMRNRVRQHAYRLALNHPTDKLFVSNVFYEYLIDDNGIITSQEVKPDIPPNASAEEAQKIIDDFNELMMEKVRNGTAGYEKRGLLTEMKTTGQEMQEHLIPLKMNGRKFYVICNGDPVMAQTLRGINRPEQGDDYLSEAHRKVCALTRFIAQNVTSRSPNFVFTNMTRDFTWAISSTNTRFGAKYGLQFERNIGRAMALLAKNQEDRRRDQLVKEFYEDGAATGFVTILRESEYQRAAKRRVSKGRTHKIGRSLGSFLDGMSTINESVENVCRLAAYITVRESGKSRLIAANEAKNVSANFNRKGSGIIRGQKNKFIAQIPAMLQNSFMFFNAGMQGLKAYTDLWNNDKGAFAGKAGFALAKNALIAHGVWMGLTMLSRALCAGFGDDEEYDALPDHIRRNNFVVSLGGGRFIKIPLAIEIRPFVAIGDAVYRTFQGYDRIGDAVAGVMSSFLDAVPYNPVDQGGGIDKTKELLNSDEVSRAYGNILKPIIPSGFQPFVEAYWSRVKFSGQDVGYITKWNGDNPEYQRADKRTSEQAIAVSEFLNRISGGDSLDKGAVNLNPSKMEHLLGAYLGGMFTFATQVTTTANAVIKGGDELDELNPRDMPLINTLYMRYDGVKDRTTNIGASKAIKEAKHITSRYDRYVKASKSDNWLEAELALKKLDAMDNDYEIDLYRSIVEMNKERGELYREKDLVETKKERDAIDREIFAINEDIVKMMKDE